MSLFLLIFCFVYFSTNSRVLLFPCFLLLLNIWLIYNDDDALGLLLYCIYACVCVCFCSLCFGSLALHFVVVDGRLDGVLGEHGAVQLDRWQAELLGYVGVLDLERVLGRLALDPLGGERARGDGRAAAERLELGVDDLALVVHAYLQLHDVATGGRAHQAGAHVRLAFVERADIARILVVVEHLLVIAAASCRRRRLDADERSQQHTVSRYH